MITAIIHDDQDISQCSDVIVRNQSMDSLQSSFTNGSNSPSRNSECFKYVHFVRTGFLEEAIRRRLVHNPGVFKFRPGFENVPVSKYWLGIH